MIIAAAAYPLDPVDTFAAYEAKIRKWVHEAKADLLVFPEYGAMELAAIDNAAGDLAQSIDAAANWRQDADKLHETLAQDYRCHILAASGPALPGPINRASFFGPDGPIGHQDKLIMTRFERETWGITHGHGAQVFDTPLGRIGILICYDAEFPLLARAMVDQGAQILLVPSCTDALAGYWRVRIGAMARALENQCITVQSPTVGLAPWCPAVDENVGAAGIYGPPDLGFPPTGVLAEGELNTPGWVRAEIDPAIISRVRSEGQVLNHKHWDEQQGRLVSGSGSLPKTGN